MLWKSVAVFIGSALLVVVLGKVILPLLRRLHIRQTIRDDGPQRHLTKAGTPTMGGLIFIAAMLIVFAINCGLQPYRWIWLFSLLAFGLIGFLDDMYKVVLHRNLGLTGKQKLVAQFIAAALLLTANALLMERGTVIYSPASLFGSQAIAWFDLGWAYYPIIAILLVGMVNAVNLTDGLDGLAAGVSIPVFVGFAITSSVLRNSFGLTADLTYYAAAMGGGCLGFLFYNRYPAKVFMGDTGSMSLGGAVVGFMLVSRMEIVLIGFGLVYLIEALSVMLQVAGYKLTGKRLFLMAPLHHHFELRGWRETKVTALFCLASAMFVTFTLLVFS